MFIGTRIKLLRKERGLTLKELSEGIMSVPYLSNIEAGKFEPNKEMLKSLAERLKVPKEYLLNHSVASQEAREELEQLYLLAANDFMKAKDLIKEYSKDKFRYSAVYHEILFKIIYCVYLYKIGEYEKATSLNVNCISHYIKEDQIDRVPFNGRLAFLYFWGVSNYYKRNLISSLKYFEKLIEILPLGNNFRPNAFYNMSAITYELRRYNESLKHAKKSLELHIENHNWIKIGELYNFIGVIYWEIGDLEEANKYLDKSLEIAELKEIITLKQRIVHNKGLIAQKAEKYFEAIEYYYTTIALRKETNSPDLLCSYLGIVECYLLLDDIEKANEIAKIAQKYINSESDMYRFELQHAEILYKIGEKQSFIEKIENVINYYEENQNRQELVGLYQKAGDYYFQNRKYKDAAIHYHKELINQEELNR
ncbi:tetratricopeptide repeat protein [Ferdinandcohnia sp. SAFN-114]|uniref:tetratricopeptide repeat protein n=1 Tax=Ferdinandcohnia sp. SAFN-114 TaxID=3387275 RepID=UPI003F80FB5E